MSLQIFLVEIDLGFRMRFHLVLAQFEIGYFNNRIQETDSGGNSLSDYCCKGHTEYAHIEFENEQKIKSNIENTRHNEKV